MQRININKNLVQSNQSIKNFYSTIKYIPNGNTDEEIPQKLFINNLNQTKRASKFLPIKERQKIIREINQTQTQFNLSKNSLINQNSTQNKFNTNILYTKKRKNFIDRSIKTNSPEERKTKIVNGINDIKLKENKILVNKNNKNKGRYAPQFSKEKYQLNLKNYKNTEDKFDPNERFLYSKNKINNFNLYESNMILPKEEVYQKPLKNKISVNLNKAYKKNNKMLKNIASDINIMNSAQKEKMSCIKIKNFNGCKKTIFNMINNYNTQTIQNKETINILPNPKMIEQNEENQILPRNKSSSIISTKFTNNLKSINCNTNYLYKNKIVNQNTKLHSRYTNNKSVSANKNIRLKRHLYLNEETNLFNNNNFMRNTKYIFNNHENENILTEIYKNNIESNGFKNSRKHLENIQSHQKKPIIDTNLISNDLLSKLVEKDLISFTYNVDKFNKETFDKPLENKLQENSRNKNNKTLNSINTKDSNAKTDISRNKKCVLYLSLTHDSKKLKKYKTVSLVSNQEEAENNNENNLKNVKSRNNNELKNTRNNSHKDLGNNLISKEIIFPININRSMSFYNSDDDIMNSSIKEKENEKRNLLFKNNNIKKFKNYNHKFMRLYNISKEGINNETEKTRSQSKDYYFNYLSKKINNDILNEDKINKLGKDLYNIEFSNKNKYCNKCKNNYIKCCCNLSKNKNTNFININNRIDDNPIIKTRSITMNFRNNNFNQENIFEKNNLDNNNNQIIRNKSDLKLDISNGMHNSQNNIQNLNLNSAENGSFNSGKFEIIENNNNQEMKNRLNNDDKNETELNNHIDIDSNQDKKSDRKKQSEMALGNEFDIEKSKKNINEKIFDLKDNDNFINDFFIEENKQKKFINSTKNSNNNRINLKVNKNDIRIIELKEKPIKHNYLNKDLQKISPILSDILENVNIITPNNYFTVKNKILKLITDNYNMSTEFVNILYSVSINQIKYQPIYSKLFKDIDKFYHKKDKSKSIIRTHLMKLCKTNFKKIKVRLENIKNITNDINFIGELINTQMVSKKVGLQCMTHLFNKFQKYNEEKNLINKFDEKYLYLENIINLMNKFGTCIYFYQKERIRDNELIYFENEIDKNIESLKEILNNINNKDMPKITKIKLLNLIKKAENEWNPTYIEQHKNNILKKIYENVPDEDFSNINKDN